jgi:hypothetical protein
MNKLNFTPKQLEAIWKVVMLNCRYTRGECGSVVECNAVGSDYRMGCNKIKCPIMDDLLK